jgi:hypothetical protein
MANANDQPVAAIDWLCEKPPTATRLHHVVRLLRFNCDGSAMFNDQELSDMCGIVEFLFWDSVGAETDAGIPNNSDHECAF